MMWKGMEGVECVCVCVWMVCERGSARKSRRGDCVRNEREGADKNAVRPQAWCIHIDDDSRGGSIL